MLLARLLLSLALLSSESTESWPELQPCSVKEQAREMAKVSALLFMVTFQFFDQWAFARDTFNQRVISSEVDTYVLGWGHKI